MDRIDLDGICELYDVSRQTVARWQRVSNFPRPVHAEGRKQFWDREAVESWTRTTAETIKKKRQIEADVSDELEQAVALLWRIPQDEWRKRTRRKEAGAVIQWAMRRGYITPVEYHQYIEAGQRTIPNSPAAVDMAYENLILALRERCPNFVIEYLSQPTPEGDYWAQMAERGEGPFAGMDTEGQGDTVSMSTRTGRITAIERE